MSLINPNWFERQSAVKKAAYIGALGLIVLGAVLFASSQISNWWSNRQINQARANVANAMNAVANAKETVTGDKVAENRALQDVQAAANDVIATSTATDQAKAEANAAVANYVAAKNANRPVGTTEDDLRKKLEALGQ